MKYFRSACGGIEVHEMFVNGSAKNWPTGTKRPRPYLGNGKLVPVEETLLDRCVSVVAVLIVTSHCFKVYWVAMW